MYDSNSLISQRSLSTRMLESSTTVRWTSALVERHRCEEASRTFEGHSTPDIHLVVQLDGDHRLAVLENGRWRSGRYFPGSVGMRAGGETPQMRSACESHFEIAHLYIPHGTLSEAAEEFRKAGQPTRHRPLSALVFQDALVATTIKAILNALRAGATDLYADQAVHWLAVHLLTWHGGYDVQNNKAPGMSDSRLSRAITLIKDRSAEPLSLSDLAREACVSKFHFARLFRERTGQSPYAFLVAERMASARDLLSSSELPISAVACRVGFASAAQFSTVFKRIHHVTPSVFRVSAQIG